MAHHDWFLQILDTWLPHCWRLKHWIIRLVVCFGSILKCIYSSVIPFWRYLLKVHFFWKTSSTQLELITQSSKKISSRWNWGNQQKQLLANKFNNQNCSSPKTIFLKLSDLKWFSVLSSPTAEHIRCIQIRNHRRRDQLPLRSLRDLRSR